MQPGHTRHTRLPVFHAMSSYDDWMQQAATCDSGSVVPLAVDVPLWTLDARASHDDATILFARKFVETLRHRDERARMSPIQITDLLLKTATLVQDHGVWVHPDCRNFSFPDSIRGTTPALLPVWMYHVIISPLLEDDANCCEFITTAFYVFDMEFKLIDRQAKNGGLALDDGEAALLSVAACIHDMIGVHPILADMLYTVSHRRLVPVIAVFAKSIHEQEHTNAGVERALCHLVDTPWQIDSSTEFCTLWREALDGGCVVRDTLQETRGASFIVDDCVGVYVSDTDKLLVYALLVYTCDLALGQRLYTCTGVPDVVRETLTHNPCTPAYVGTNAYFTPKSLEWE